MCVKENLLRGSSNRNLHKASDIRKKVSGWEWTATGQDRWHFMVHYERLANSYSMHQDESFIQMNI
jgi:hypothetical protein